MVVVAVETSTVWCEEGRQWIYAFGKKEKNVEP